MFHVVGCLIWSKQEQHIIKNGVAMEQNSTFSLMLGITKWN